MRLLPKFAPIAVSLFLGMVFLLFTSENTVTPAVNEENKARPVIDDMLEAIGNVKTLRYNLKVS